MSKITYIVLIPIVLINFMACKQSSTTKNKNKVVVTKMTKELTIKEYSSLLELYKGGPIYLIADEKYGAQNNWDELFDRWFDTINYRDDGYRRKNILLGPKGTIYMSQRNRHEIWRFDSLGNLDLRFGEKGGKPHQFPMLPNLQDMVQDKYLLTSDVNSRLKLFDLDGNYVKGTTLGYMGKLIGTDDGNLLASGSAIWRNKGWRNLINTIDIENWNEKTIHSYFREDIDFRDNNKYIPPGIRVTKKNGDFDVKIRPTRYGKMYLPSLRAYRSKTVLLKTGGFIIADKVSGKLDYYDNNGDLVNTFQLEIDPLKITDKDAREYYESHVSSIKKQMERVKNHPRFDKETRKELLQHYRHNMDSAEYFKDLDNYHPTLPYFSNILVDIEGNLLVFEYTRKEEGNNKFNVVAYASTGEILARTSFYCKDYDIAFTAGRFILTKDYVYAVANKKDVEGVPVRLVRFKMMITDE